MHMLHASHAPQWRHAPRTRAPWARAESRHAGLAVCVVFETARSCARLLVRLSDIHEICSMGCASRRRQRLPLLSRSLPRASRKQARPPSPTVRHTQHAGSPTRASEAPTETVADGRERSPTVAEGFVFLSLSRTVADGRGRSRTVAHGSKRSQRSPMVANGRRLEGWSSAA